MSEDQKITISIPVDAVDNLFDMAQRFLVRSIGLLLLSGVAVSVYRWVVEEVFR